MGNFEDILPRHKSDLSRAKRLKHLKRDEILPLLPDLLEWIQDMNWPVAPIILEVLITFPEEIVPHIQDVLASDDDNWKWFVLHRLITELPLESRVQFKEYLKRVAETPTPNELAEELNEIAKEILDTV